MTHVSHEAQRALSADGVLGAQIEVKGLCKTFNRRGGGQGDAGYTQALDNVSVTFEPGEFVSVIGPSGCGKTTLLRLIAGLDKPTSGEIFVSGKAISGPGPERAVVFQQPALLPWASLLENVCLGLRVRGWRRRQRMERGRAALEMVGLTGFENHLPKELSGGMQQRASIARALVLEPPVLLMDEPFGSLDEISRRRLQREFLGLWDEHARTCVFITHNVEEAIILADRVVVMSPRPGRIIDVVDVPVPRPRSLEQQQSAEFLAARERIWKLIEEWDA